MKKRKIVLLSLYSWYNPIYITCIVVPRLLIKTICFLIAKFSDRNFIDSIKYSYPFQSMHVCQSN